MKVSFPYGKEFLDLEIPDNRLKGVIVSKLHSYKTEKTQEELVLEAMANPIGTPRLSELAKGKKTTSK